MTPKNESEITSPKIRTPQIKLLEQLCNACAVSGDEGEVRALVLEQVRPHADEVKLDALGNVLATRKGTARGRKRLRVMLDAHMDEVGFMLTHDEGSGIFRFDTVGGLDIRQLVGKPVWVGRDHVSGVIGAKPIHLTTAKERERSIPLDTLRIDIGPGGDPKIKVGDWATFATSFTRLGPSLRGKALDDRLGVVLLIELLKHAPPNIDLLAAFTVQEEVGLRGARVAAYAFEPDIGIALDCTPALDLPIWEDDDHTPSENTSYNTRLGAGPAIYTADRATMSDPRLIRHLVETAEELDIPYQFRQPGGGSTDAGAIQLAHTGVPSISVSVPGRYLHTAASIARLSDWQHTITLLYAALSRMTPKILAQDR